MRKIRGIPVGEYTESGARIQKSHYTFYEARLGNEDEGDYEVIAWARWETFFQYRVDAHATSRFRIRASRK